MAWKSVDCAQPCACCFFFQAEDGIRDAQESRGLGDVYKRQSRKSAAKPEQEVSPLMWIGVAVTAVLMIATGVWAVSYTHLTLPTIYSV